MTKVLATTSRVHAVYSVTRGTLVSINNTGTDFPYFVKLDDGREMWLKRSEIKFLGAPMNKDDMRIGTEVIARTIMTDGKGNISYDKREGKIIKINKRLIHSYFVEFPDGKRNCFTRNELEFLEDSNDHKS